MGTMIPRGNISGFGVVDVALTPAAVAANISAEQLFTVPGVRSTTDVAVAVEKPTAQAGIGIVGYRVSADNQVGVTFMNTTAGSITPTAGQTYRFVIARVDMSQGSLQI